MKPTLPSILLLVIGLGSCSIISPDSSSSGPDDPAKKFGPTGIPGHLRAKTDGAGNSARSGASRAGLAGYKSTPMEDIIFTKDSETLPELADILSAPRAKTWEESDTIARARAAREGKPILIWFTDSRRSPLCKALSQELFSYSGFEVWAEEKLVRLKVDAFYRKESRGSTIDEGRDYEARVSAYVKSLKKRYKVRGHPTMIMLNPSGEVIARYSGYKRGTAEFLWGQLKHAESVSTKAYADWRAGLEKKGYREWHNRKNRKVFAKLVNYSDGELVLIDPEGSRFRTQESKLSNADKNWIDEQKKLRNMP